MQKDKYFAKKGLDSMATKIQEMAAKYPEIGKRIPTKVRIEHIFVSKYFININSMLIKKIKNNNQKT